MVPLRRTVTLMLLLASVCATAATARSISTPMAGSKKPSRITTVPRQAQFDPAEYAPYDSAGTCVVNGQAFVRTRGGDVKYGAGVSVHLLPSTTYSQEWFVKQFGANLKLSPGDERALPYIRSVVANAEGRFKFEQLPPGRYFVVAEISWEHAGGYRGMLQTAEVRLGDVVDLTRSSQVDVILRPLSGRNSKFESFKAMN